MFPQSFRWFAASVLFVVLVLYISPAGRSRTPIARRCTSLRLPEGGERPDGIHENLNAHPGRRRAELQSTWARSAVSSTAWPWPGTMPTWVRGRV